MYATSGRKTGKWLAAAVAVAVVLLAAGYAVEAREAPRQPNIVFVLTDDQDAGSLQHMPAVQTELVEKGTTFENGILTLPRCCPSRASMLRGQYPHNHGISGDAGASKFRRDGLDESTVATWLRESDYKTALIGKYLNGYDSLYVPPGWSKWYANIGRDVWARCFNDNGTEVCKQNRHPDAVLANEADEFVRSNEDSRRPLFLWLSLNAPHNPAYFQDQYADEFADTALPKPPSFDEEDVADKPGWVQQKERLSPESVAEMETLYRDRLRSLQTPDRTVKNLIDALAETGRLENTYFVFFTDNGYHLGEHRLPAGKDTPYVEDTEFPLIVRGPGVPEGQERSELVLNTDLAPTFAALAGARIAPFVDGRSFVPLLEGQPASWRTAALVEGPPSPKLSRPAYDAMRTEDGFYVEYETGERELYDLAVDPYQLENAYERATPRDVADLEARLAALSDCAADGCRTAEDGS